MVTLYFNSHPISGFHVCIILSMSICGDGAYVLAVLFIHVLFALGVAHGISLGARKCLMLADFLVAVE